MAYTKREAFQALKDIYNEVCTTKCKYTWMRRVRSSLLAKTNPLNLTDLEKRRMFILLGKIKDKRVQKALAKKNRKKPQQKKYFTRPSPAYPANQHCGETKRGNDGKKYISKPNKNGVCRWIKSKS